MIKISKYEFNSKEQVQTKIKALGTQVDENGNEYPTHKHTIVELGNIILKQGQYEINEKESIELVAPVLSDKWHVDVLWQDLKAGEDGTIDHPYGWKSYSVDIDNEGYHTFFGLSYNANKI
jgi:hypothetical protein